MIPAMTKPDQTELAGMTDRTALHGYDRDGLDCQHLPKDLPK
jgi:hypothetical protein